MPEAQAIAARGGKIVFVGTNADVARFVGPSTQVIDLAGQLAMSGSHRGARTLHRHRREPHQPRSDERRRAGTRSCRWSRRRWRRRSRASGSSAAAGIRRSGRRAPQPNVEGFPLHASLDKVSPNNPVVLTHASGHASFVNQKAMELSGITEDDGESGRRRDPEGRERQSDRAAARDGVGPRAHRAGADDAKTEARRAAASWPTRK